MDDREYDRMQTVVRESAEARMGTELLWLRARGALTRAAEVASTCVMSEEDRATLLSILRAGLAVSA